ncbi:MAG: GxxExxY protein [Pedobacter sp.]|nr:MAG: GxxExxY protein [Pedobacter sp.]
MTKQYLDNLTYRIIGAAIEVHKNLGPGLLESAYQICLEHELYLQGINFISQPTVPIFYKDIELESTLRCDLLIANCVVVELKAVDAVKSIFHAQLLTYMKLLKKPQGLLINFFTDNIVKSMKPFVNEYFNLLPD